MKYLAALILLLGTSVASLGQKTIKGIDVYGTSQITANQVQQKLGAKFAELAKQYPDGPDVEKLFGEINKRLKKMGDFAYVNIGMTIYPDDLQGLYVCIDVVDKADKVKRMSFLPEPTKTIADPEGLVGAWNEYLKKHFDLFMKGQLHKLTGNCPALHCINEFSNPELKPYLEIFQTKVPRNKDALVQLLRESKNAEQRAAAAFLLAHTTDAVALVLILEPSIADASSIVRNNVMRVLMEIANRQKEVAINIAPIIKALDYPNDTDRNKALYTLLGLTDRPENKAAIRHQAGETLLKILRLTQPNNHEPAYEILKKISGENFGDRDYVKWEAWLKKANK